MLFSIQELENQFKETSYSNPYRSVLLSDIRQDHFEEIAFYLKEGLNQDAMDRDGNTLLCKALEYEKNEISCLLLGNKADPNKHGAGRSSTLMLSKNPQTTSFLLKAGAHLYTTAESDTHFYLPHAENLDSLKQIIEAGFDINTQGPNGQTLFHSAIISNQKEVIEYVVSKGVNTQAATICGINGADFAQMPHISQEVRAYVKALQVIPTQTTHQYNLSTYLSNTDKISILGGIILIAASLFLATHSASQKENALKEPAQGAQLITHKALKKNSPFAHFIQASQNTL